MKNPSVYYQDMKLNVEANFGGEPVYDADKAVFIGNLPVFAQTENMACEELFCALNHVTPQMIAQNGINFENFVKAGHTSMSIGDVVKFQETGNVYICAACGWHLIATTLVPVHN